MSGGPRKIIALSTKGAGSNEEDRIRALVEPLGGEILPFDRKRKLRSFARILEAIRRERPDLVCVEGTGIAGGAAVMLARALLGVPYVVSSGDAVGPYVGSLVPPLGPVFGLYERLLCRFSAGFIGWTPYLAGRALSFGARRAMTAAGWAPFLRADAELAEARKRVRARLGLPEGALVIGIAGFLGWNRRVGYCYGYELVQALRRAERPDAHAMIVGEGDGKARLERLAGDQAGKRIHFVGQVPQSEVPDYLAAMDIASLPQSTDGVGSFRYTTKISEYLAAGVPIATGQIPLAYDLPGDWFWRLPGDAPWDPRYIDALASLLDGLQPGELAARRREVPRNAPLFDRERQVERVAEFLGELLEPRAVKRE